MTEKRQTDPLDVTARELLEVIQQKEEFDLSFPDYIAELRAEVDAATRKLQLAEACRDLCDETKGRRPRKDKGVPRKRKGDSDETLV